MKHFLIKKGQEAYTFLMGFGDINVSELIMSLRPMVWARTWFGTAMTSLVAYVGDWQEMFNEGIAMVITTVGAISAIIALVAAIYGMQKLRHERDLAKLEVEEKRKEEQKQ